MAQHEDELEDLRRRVAGLTSRVYRLEQRLGLELAPPVPRLEVAAAPEEAVTPPPSPLPVVPVGEGKPVVPAAAVATRPVAVASETLESVVGGR